MPKDFTARMNRETIKFVSCKKDEEPLIEELSLTYLNPARRLQLQAESIREILGSPFQMKPYPPQFQKPQLAIWGHATVCVVARKGTGGGITSMLDEEIQAVVE